MIQTIHLFRPLNRKLLEMLRSLPPADWSRPTVASRWTIKDVASHLLDGNLRTISLYRDQWPLPPATIKDYRELVDYLNRLNADWIKATQRLSPALLIQWLEMTHEPYVQCLEKLNPVASAIYSVAWAGESVSTNAFHIAREYTEKWHHQQQIREAMYTPEILTREFYHPVLQTFMMALPHAYQKVASPAGITVTVLIDGNAGGRWTIVKTENDWRFSDEQPSRSDTQLMIPGTLAWKLFTKAVSPDDIQQHVVITGNQELARPAMEMLPVMALR